MHIHIISTGVTRSEGRLCYLDGQTINIQLGHRVCTLLDGCWNGKWSAYENFFSAEVLVPQQ